MESTNDNAKPALSRRNFVKGSAVFGALMTSQSQRSFGQETPASDQINVALIGCGNQGEKLTESIVGKSKIPGINFVAVCDIWNYNRKYRGNMLRRYGFKINDYEDYREMLDKEQDLDAVLIASPDFMHHVHTRACLEAGKAVYCEKMMSNTLEGARDMVLAQRETGGILQIGHQRRSNPRYVNLLNGLVRGEKVFGRITHASAQWNRGTSSARVEVPTKKNMIIEPEKLAQYGYENMEHFRNWRLYKKYGGGPISDLGAHQIDIFNWFFGTPPISVIASGGVNYYEQEHADNVMAIYEFDTPEGISRAYYQVLTTTSALGFWERFMGDEGTVTISEIPSHNQAYREANAPPWDSLAERGLLLKDVKDIKYKPWELPKTWGTKPKPWLKSLKPSDTGITDSRATAQLDAWELPTTLEKLPHTPHLENFFSVVRSGKKEDLHCPVEDAYRSCVTVLTVNRAIEEDRKIAFSPEDFVVA